MTVRTYRILHVFPSFAIGGQQRRLARLAEAFGGEFSHHVISLDGGTSAASLFTGAEAKIEPLILEKSGFLTLGNVRRLQSAIAGSGADLLCTYNFGSIEATIANRLGARKPQVHHEDGFGADEAGGKQKLKRVLARRIALSKSNIAVPSVTLERIAVETWRLPRARVTRIPVGVDIAAFGAQKSGKGGAVIIGALGALRTEKNIARLIRCFEVAAADRMARLVIYGKGPESDALKRLAAATSVRDKVEFRGATINAPAALAGVDIYALSSDTEQMPTSLIEAMASGLPYAATNVGDIADMSAEEEREFIFDPADEAGFAAALRRLIDDEALRARLGAANRRRAEAFALDKMAESFRQLYLESIEGSR